MLAGITEGASPRWRQRRSARNTRAADQAIALARRAHGRFRCELAEFIRFPSVSAERRHTKDVERCAHWLAERLRRIGMDHVRIVRTKGHPIVCADWLRAPGRKTLLIYGHYDVQPADPLAAWESPPFSATVRGRFLHGRGASDDKGQLYVHVKALESYLATTGALPINVRCVFEGEEEIGSANLAELLRAGGHGRADFAVVSDTWMLERDRPALTESLRGALTLELTAKGPAVDLHSGNFGGAVKNPVHALCEIIARLHDEAGALTIPGFYERVRPIVSDERAYMAEIGPSDARILRDARVGHAWGERGFSLYERTTIRPALTVTGIRGGYQGSGAKAIIPASAAAQLDLRLVPDQDPARIEALLRAHLRTLTPPGIRLGVRTLFRAAPVVVTRSHSIVRAAMHAYRRGFGVSPVFLRVGGTIPIVHLLQTELQIPTVLLGFALPEDRLHAPNERFFLPNFARGIETSIHLLARLGEDR
jgi:acetylornithine deacetylase/succinyl-diaminopimelate desuccinylase-like protein